MRGIKLTQAKGSKVGKVWLPVSIEILGKMREVWQVEATYDSEMLWAAASLCFFGFLRSGELTVPSESGYDAGAHLGVQDVSVDDLSDPQVLQIRLKASKTDPFRVGVNVFVGRTKCKLCPVAAVLSYMTKRGQSPGPLFWFSNKKPLTRSRFVTEVKEALTKAGMDSSGYSGHSFRSGAATTAAKCGQGDATIKMLGRWQSNAYQVYIKTPREQLAQVSRVLTAGEQ